MLFLYKVHQCLPYKNEKMKNYLCIYVCFASPIKDAHVSQIKFEYTYQYMYYEIYRYYFIMKFINILTYHSYMMTEQVPVWLLKLLKFTDWNDSINNCFFICFDTNSLLFEDFLLEIFGSGHHHYTKIFSPFIMIFQKKPKLWLQCTQFSAVFASNIWQK